MKTRDKAKELVENFSYSVGDIPECNIDYRAKQCALICVDEMLFELEDIEDGYRMDRVEYWEEVKQELEKL